MEEKYEKITPKNFNPLNFFLQKFKKIIGDSEQKRDLVTQIFSDEIGFSIKKENIKIKDGVVYLKASPIVRSEVFMRKQKIITKLKDCGLNISDIK